MTPLLKHTLLGTVWAASLAGAVWYGKSTAPAPETSATRQVVRTPGDLRPASASLQGDAAGAAARLADGGSDGVERQPMSPEALAARASNVFSTEDPVERMTGFLKLLGDLRTNEEMTAVYEAMMNGFEPRGRGREFSMLLTEWAKRDPVAALEQTQKAGDGRGRWGAYTALSVWAQRDPSAAVAWAQAKGPTDPKDENGNWFMVGALNGLAKVDLDRAATLAQEMTRSQARGEVMDRLLDGFAKRGDAAQKWVDTLPEGVFREGVTRRLASQLANKDPKATVAFLDQQPAGEWKKDAYTEVVDRWADRDPNAAGEWLAQQDAGPDTDDPRRVFAWKIREKDPESAMAWAGTISNGNRRTKVMVDIARDWFKREPDAARQYVDRQGWPDEVRRRVLN